MCSKYGNMSEVRFVGRRPAHSLNITHRKKKKKGKRMKTWHHQHEWRQFSNNNKKQTNSTFVAILDLHSSSECLVVPVYVKVHELSGVALWIMTPCYGMKGAVPVLSLQICWVWFWKKEQRGGGSVCSHKRMDWTKQYHNYRHMPDLFVMHSWCFVSNTFSFWLWV